MNSAVILKTLQDVLCTVSRAAKFTNILSSQTLKKRQCFFSRLKLETMASSTVSTTILSSQATTQLYHVLTAQRPKSLFLIIILSFSKNTTTMASQPTTQLIQPRVRKADAKCICSRLLETELMQLLCKKTLSLSHSSRRQMAFTLFLKNPLQINLTQSILVKVEITLFSNCRHDLIST